MVGARGWGRRCEDVVFDRTEFQSGKMKKFWRWDGGDGCTMCRYIIVYLKMVKMIKLYVMYNLPQFKKKLGK